eukprot:jgi/Ulvmu1/433/UM001_0440.1
MLRCKDCCHFHLACPALPRLRRRSGVVVLRTLANHSLERSERMVPARSASNITAPVSKLKTAVAMRDVKTKAFLQREQFTAPDWAASLKLKPTETVGLAMTPTPVHEWKLPGLPDDVTVHVKRDDMTGLQMSGNKVRKLEFLMAEALAAGADSVITIGGIQSNHCRATAAAATYLGMECHLILRNTEHHASQDAGLVGNLLPERLQGAHIHQVSKREYVTHGSEALGEKLAEELRAQGRKPYVVPVGGSNALGCWGYMTAMHELAQQTPAAGAFTHIVMACGSGATTGGLALANHLSGYGAKVIGYGVCDDEDYFYDFIDGLYEGLGADVAARDIVTMVQGKGEGYALSREEELQTVVDVAMATGVVLDPVYSGKALHAFLIDVKASPEKWSGARVLLLHTGGLLGMYDKVGQLQPIVEQLQRCKRLLPQ